MEVTALDGTSAARVVEIDTRSEAHVVVGSEVALLVWPEIGRYLDRHHHVMRSNVISDPWFGYPESGAAVGGWLAFG